MINTIILNVIQYLSKKSRLFITALGFILVICIGTGRYLTGPEYAFSLFYLLPIILVTWFAGKREGIFIAVASAVSWLLADLMSKHTYSTPVIPYVNETFRLSVFIIIIIMLSTLKRVLEREKTSARKDFLTGIANRQAFIEYAEVEIKRCLRYKSPLTIAYIDCDNFKGINDSLGHQEGDELLASVADTLQKSLRTTDIVSRLGGDEFALLLPDTKYESSQRVIRKIQKNLLDIMQKNRWPVTFSFGMVTFNRPPVDVDELINKADALMYAAKQNGKNMIRQDVVDKETSTTAR